MSSDKVRTLVVDDTALYRRILTEALEATGEADVVGSAPHGRLALARLDTLAVDLVLLDVEMPELDGPGTLAEIQKRANPPTVVMISGATTRSAQSTLNALRMGALDFIRKPDGGDPESSRRELVEKLRPLLRHVKNRKNLRQATVSSAPTAPAGHALLPNLGTGLGATPLPIPASTVALPRAPLATPAVHTFAAIGIGVSTGGPNALGEMIPRLPVDLPLPILLVQHMPPGFTASLAEHLDRYSPIRVKEAEEGEAVRGGCVYIAPGGKHMVLRRLPAGGLIVGLNEQAPVHSCRPSVDVLFRSMAAQVDGAVLAVVMTGMGNDGCDGVRALKRQGAYCLTQTEKSCVVYGMPLAVDEAALSDEQVPLDLLALRVTQLARRGTRHA